MSIGSTDGVPAYHSMQSTEGEDFKIDYEYEMSEKGERIVLGRGSFGVVYSGIESVTRRKMAIKEIQTIENCDSG